MAPMTELASRPRPHVRCAALLLVAVAAATTLSSCASGSRRPPVDLSSASCLTKQNYCLDGCKDSFESAELGRALGSVLAKPKSQAERTNLANASASQLQESRATLSQCRSSCDKTGDVCRDRSR